ncbi:hypothetical protein E1293_42400 [Actinomadura darangshiensis]|uniref:Uncharacterized protein n=1 Tax=Actinomadura darangshiensis TaxID=705336 RepID=A0A4R5A052_9ACTN|nr:hypothetical protein [Actinomadura darangshiensis]TDD63819.1 hypothetical protein E1293_42400 [Actinomadura darangshiensis]
MDYSAVQIGEGNVLALRAFLLEGPEAWVALRDDLQKDDETAAGYMSLLYGAFNVAVRRRFSPTYTVGDIVRFVADLRIKAEEDADLIDTLVAEDLIRRAVDAPPLKKEVPDDLTAALHAEVYILLYIVTESDFDGAGLEQFIEEATTYTKEWLAVRHAKAAQ